MAGIRRKKWENSIQNLHSSLIFLTLKSQKRENYNFTGRRKKIWILIFAAFLLKCYLVELYCFWWNLGIHWEKFELFLCSPLPLRALLISLCSSLLFFFISCTVCVSPFCPCWCLFSTPPPIPLKLPPSRLLKWLWGVSFLDGLIGAEIFIIPRAIFLGWPSWLHFTHYCWKVWFRVSLSQPNMAR